MYTERTHHSNRLVGFSQAQLPKRINIGIAPMTEVPYYFDTPVPSDFRKNGWFKNHKTLAFVTWAFSRCSTKEHKELFDHKLITLKPYQFIFGRKRAGIELGMTESEIRNQVNTMLNAGFIKNATNSTTKRYTIYEWLPQAFTQIQSIPNDQVNDQVTTKSRPSNNHKVEVKKEKIIDIKESIACNTANSFFYNSLKDFPGTEEDKASLTKAHPEEMIDKAVWFCKRRKKMTTSYIGWCCNDGKDLVLNTWWTQVEIFDDNPGAFDKLEWSGDFIREKYSSKEVHLKMLHKSYVELFTQLFIPMEWRNET